MSGDAQRHPLVVVGASAGGVEALRTLVATLPVDLAATVLVVLHVTSTGRSVLPEILDRAGPLPARHARDGDPLEHGQILVAPPNVHLLVEDDRIRLSLGPRENGHRPAIDPLFRSAARAQGAKVVGVVLSGMLDDGTAGLRAIKIHGGVALVQDPRDAAFASMPRSAIDHVRPDHVLPAHELGPMLGRLAAGDGEQAATAAGGHAAMEANGTGSTNVYTCPDCGGALEEAVDGDLLRFSCKVGHLYSEESLLHLQSQQLETALWAALRALEDRVQLTRSVAARMAARPGTARSAERYADEAAEAVRHAQVLRALLEQTEAMTSHDPVLHDAVEDA